MKNVALILLVFLTSCEGYSDIPIDIYKGEERNSGFLGHWKIVEDTDRKNYVIIDGFDSLNVGYANAPKIVKCQFALTYMNRHGTNPYFAGKLCYITNVSGVDFVNIRSKNWPLDSLFYYLDKGDYDSPKIKWGPERTGFVFARVFPMNYYRDSFAVATVVDKNLRTGKIKGSMKDYFKANINNPGFYGDTLHFYKVWN